MLAAFLANDLLHVLEFVLLLVLVVAVAIFMYYISDVSGKLTASGRKIWRIVALVIVVASVVWGFSVLGSPRAQQLSKYDEQKLMICSV